MAKIFTGSPEYFMRMAIERKEERMNSYKEMEKAFEKLKRFATPNNRLKMSGKPMKRRGV